jgi:hypothetical protein
MQNAKFKMQTGLATNHVVFAFCILNLAFPAAL